MKCARCGFIDEGKFCSNCGSALAEQRRIPRPVTVILGPVYEYFRHAGAALYPSKLAQEIESRRMDLATAIGFLLSAIAISSIFEPIFQSLEVELKAERQGIWGIPVIGEAIRALLQIVVTGFAVSPMYFILRTYNRKISYKMSVTAVIAMLATLYPWTYLLELIGRSSSVSMRPLNGLVTFLLLTNLYATLFRVKFSQVMGYFVLLAGALFGLSFVVPIVGSLLIRS